MTQPHDQLANAAQDAVQAGRASAMDHAVLGWAALAAGDDEGAQAAFHAALKFEHHYPEALAGLANILRRQGRLRDAVLHCDAALAQNPDSAAAWLERAFVLSSGGSMAAATESYRRVLALEPGHAAAHAGLAAIHGRDGQPDLARHHAGLALTADPLNPIATAALAALELEQGEPDAARARLTSVLNALAGASTERSLLANQLGDAEAALGNPEAAYAAYQLSKSDFAALHGPRFASTNPAAAFAERLNDALKTVPLVPPSSDFAPAPTPNHLFLIGFPRSGTTMTENILASIPGVTALEEMPTLAQADQHFLAPPDGIARLMALSEADLRPYRAAYWQAVQQSLGQVPGDTFVDMDPLKGTRLPVIARLFPRARIVVMRRDPRDVVWSCFHTHFALTNAAMDFTGLAGAARFYAAMMALIDQCRQRSALRFHDLRYEDLIRDFAGTTRQLCAFAELPWSEDLLRFDRTAQRRGVATASAGQVRKGLYDGSGQWRPFASQLAPVLPILQPWIERFGYAD